VTLLQLAVTASVALVPVLLGVLLVVAGAREADTAKPAKNSDRHVSVRHVAALKTFEFAIARRDRIRASLPSAETLLERFPQCRAEWDGRGGFLTQARRVLARREDASLSPAARIAFQLSEIDHSLLEFSSGANRRVTDAVGFDGARWLDAVTLAFKTPVEAPGYPGHRFWVQCADISGAASALARSNGRMLKALAWRGTEVDRVVARWRPDQYVDISPRHVARTNPWAGLPGCIYFGGTIDGESPTYYMGGVRGLDDRLCARVEMLGATEEGAGARPLRLAGEPTPDLAVGDERWKVPPSLAVMLRPLETLHRPDGSLYRDYTASIADTDDARAPASFGPNRIVVGGSPVDVGFSIDLTIDPDVQALAQQTAACYTGRDDVCQALGMRRKEDASRALGSRMLEQAMVRMAAIAIVDVATGRIEALAGALSPCTRQEYDGPGREARCDKLPYPVRYRPDALMNPAVFHDAMPASTIKPIMATAFLSDPVVGPRWLAAELAEMDRAPKAVPSAQSLRGQLMRSDSARFLDRMFCADRDFAPCDRPWKIQAAARAFGWNDLCDTPREDCGKRGLLFGRSAEATAVDAWSRPLESEISYGRLLTEPLGGKLGAPFRLRAVTPLDIAKVRRCAAGPDGKRPSKDDWEKCSGGVVVDVVAEGWGQGHARSSALGEAGMMATLAAAANGQAETHRPHLVNALRGAGPADESKLELAVAPHGMDGAEQNRIPQDVARVILSGLSFGHRAGTSRLACEQVFDAKTCAEADWIAGKTGTPTFPNDNRTLDELAKLCAPGAVIARRDAAACGPLRPYKWYVAAYRIDRNDSRWTKVIGVLTERNWVAETGQIHGAGDHGPNPAAEIAMQIAGRQTGLLPWSAH
jgi:hypothetical protein